MADAPLGTWAGRPGRSRDPGRVGPAGDRGDSRRPRAAVPLDPTREELVLGLRPKILAVADGMQAAGLVALVLGSVVCFGGAVWWFAPTVVWLTFLLVCARLVQLLLRGRMP